MRRHRHRKQYRKKTQPLLIDAPKGPGLSGRYYRLGRDPAPPLARAEGPVLLTHASHLSGSEDSGNDSGNDHVGNDPGGNAGGGGASGGGGAGGSRVRRSIGVVTADDLAATAMMLASPGLGAGGGGRPPTADSGHARVEPPPHQQHQPQLQQQQHPHPHPHHEQKRTSNVSTVSTVSTSSGGINGDCCDACPEDPLCLCIVPACERCTPIKVRRESSSKRRYTLCEVTKHNSHTSCWLTADTTVYDITAYLRSGLHPGSSALLLKAASGKDCSKDINFHSKQAKAMWGKMKIGKLIDCKARVARDPSCRREKGFFSSFFG